MCVNSYLNYKNIIYTNPISISTLPIPTKPMDYTVVSKDGTFPTQFGYLQIRYGDHRNEYTAIFHDQLKNILYINTWKDTLNNWTGWKQIITNSDLNNMFLANKEVTNSSLDVNELVQAGFSPYLLRAENKNAPPFTAYLLVINWRNSNSTIKQIAIGYNSSRLATRYRYNGVWSNWEE